MPPVRSAPNPTALLALLLLFLSSGLGACRRDVTRVATAVPTAAVPTVTVTVPAPTGTATATEAAPAKRATITPAPLSPAALPDPAVLDVPWEDREIFAPGLIADRQAVLADLPGATVYHLDVTLDASLTALTGQQEVLYTNREEVTLDAVYFRLFPNLAGGESSVSDVEVNGWPVQPAYEQQRSALRVPFPAPLAPGEQAVIRLAFAVSVPVAGGGNYGTFIFDDDVLALAHFYPMVAVYDDEGWNIEIAPESGDVVYAESSFYLARISAPAGLTLVASGFAVEEQLSDGRQVITYAAGPMRDFYLVASERYRPLRQEMGETTVIAYTFPEFAEAGREALAHAVAAVDTFNETFGLYPFAELELASTPTLALGVEYPGAIVVASRLYDPAGGYPPVALETTTVHEVAHQWFYSTVGNDQVDEPWLDEALAQYATLLYFDDLYGAAGAEEFRDSLVRRWQLLEQEEIPVGLPVAAYDGPAYSAIVYGRGPLFFDALEEEMDRENFDQFLRDYYQTHSWGIATTESLRAEAEAACSCDLGPLFAEWIYPD